MYSRFMKKKKFKEKKGILKHMKVKRIEIIHININNLVRCHLFLGILER